MKSRRLILGVAFTFLLAGAALVTLRPGAGEPGPLPDPDPAEIEVVPEDPDAAGWQLAAHLAALVTDAPPPAPAALAERLGVAGKSPQEVLSLVDARLHAEPYRGVLRDAATSFDGGAANPLDRARLLRELLSAAGHQARVVSGTGSVAYPTTTPDHDFQLDPLLRAKVAEEVASLAPPLWEAARADTAWVTSAAAPRELPGVYWAQVRDGEGWTDLLPADTTRGQGAPEPLTPEREAKLAWTVTLRFPFKSFDFDPVYELMAYTATAQDLHAKPITFLLQPTHGMEYFKPKLLVGAETVAGQTLYTGPPFDRFGEKPKALEPGTRAGLDYVKLSVEVKGPGHTSEHERVLIPTPREDVSTVERFLQISTVVNLSVVTGFVSEEIYEQAILDNARFAGRILLGDFEAKNEISNRVALRPLGLLDASQRSASHFGEASASATCFRGRPGIALEREFVEVEADGFQRKRALDLMDLGHVVLGPGAAQAAVEQGVVDGCLEAIATDAPNAVTSGHVLAKALRTGAGLLRGEAKGWRDSIDGAQPSYFLAEFRGFTGGIRLDVGPQVIPVLEDGSGGSRVAVEKKRDRVADAVDLANWGASFVPKGVMPYAFLMGGLGGYLLKLREAYGGATAALYAIAAAMDAPERARALEKISKELEKTIRQLGPTLASGILNGILDQLAGDLIPKMRGPMGALANRAVNKEYENARDAFTNRLFDLESPNPGDPPPARNYLPESVMQLTQALKDGALDLAQRRAFFTDHAGSENAALVRKQLAEGSYDATKIPPRDRTLMTPGTPEHSEARWQWYVAHCARFDKAPRGRGVFEAAYEANLAKAKAGGF